MKKIVLDTSVFVSALLGAAGPARKLLRLCLEKAIEPQIGNALYLEYEDLLSRESLWSRCLLTAREREQVFNAYLSVCRWSEVYYLWRPNLPDEADNHLIELAVACGASHIVTFNLKDLARGELLFPDLKVVHPKAFIKEQYQ